MSGMDQSMIKVRVHPAGTSKLDNRPAMKITPARMAARKKPVGLFALSSMVMISGPPERGFNLFHLL
jgi:hypothetical protein